MLNALRRLFRRVPPHLAGRVPVDAGVGVARDDYRIGYGPEIRPVVLSMTAPRQHAELNTFLEREGCIPWSAEEFDRHRVKFTPAPSLPSGARPDWAVRDADMERARIREAERARERQASHKIPSEVRMAMDKAARQREMPMADSSEPEWESGNPRWMAHLRKAAQETAVRKMTEHQNRRVWTPPDAPQMTLEDFGWPKSCAHGDDCCLPECAPKPSPAENAKRYTREGGTW